jgi:hypothetical protein
VRERVARALPGGRDIVAGARAVSRARRRTCERGEGERRPLLFVAQKVKKGDFTADRKLVLNCTFSPLHRSRSVPPGRDAKSVIWTYLSCRTSSCCYYCLIRVLLGLPCLSPPSPRPPPPANPSPCRQACSCLSTDHIRYTCPPNISSLRARDRRESR